MARVRKLGQVWAALSETRSARSSERGTQVLLKKKKKNYIRLSKWRKTPPVLGWTDTGRAGRFLSHPRLCPQPHGQAKKSRKSLGDSDSTHLSELL